MLTPLNRFVAIAGSLSVVVAICLGFRAVDEQERAELAHIAPPAGDALVQAVDLTHIAGFRYVDDHTLDVTDETGKNFKMELTEACPGLKDAKEFSLVTESFRNLDRFTAIGVKGSICTFKDFSPIPVAAPSTKAP